MSTRRVRAGRIACTLSATLIAVAGLIARASFEPVRAAAVPTAPAAPASAAGTDALAARAQQLFDDANAFWARQFSALGGNYPAATLTLYSGTLTGATCASAQPLTGSFYCPANQQVYLDKPFLRQLSAQTANGDDAAVALIVGHELGHYVQNLLGTTALVEEARSRSVPAISRLTWTTEELQADCYSGLWIATVQNKGIVKLGGDLSGLLAAIASASVAQQSLVPAGVIMPDPILTYGSSAQRLKWLQHGLQGHGFADCDTFSAESAGTL